MRVAFDHVQRVGVEIAGPVEPCLPVEAGDVDDQRVAVPPCVRPPHPRIDRRFLLPVHEDLAPRVRVLIDDPHPIRTLEDLKWMGKIGRPRHARQKTIQLRIGVQVSPGLARKGILPVLFPLRQRFRLVRESCRPRRRSCPGDVAPQTPVTTTGDGPPSWSSRSQLAVDSVCQMPFRSGFLSHDVRGIERPWVCTGGWIATANPTASTNAARERIRIGRHSHLFCWRAGSPRADEERTPVRQRHVGAVCLGRAVPRLIPGHLDLRCRPADPASAGRGGEACSASRSRWPRSRSCHPAS